MLISDPHCQYQEGGDVATQICYDPALALSHDSTIDERGDRSNMINFLQYTFQATAGSKAVFVCPSRDVSLCIYVFTSSEPCTLLLMKSRVIQPFTSKNK